MEQKKPTTFDECLPHNYLNYKNLIDKGMILPGNIDLKKKAVLEKYNKWIDKIADLKPKEYMTDSIEKIEGNMFSEICVELAINIFGERIINDLEEFIKNLNVSQTNSLLDGVCICQVDSQTNKIMDIYATIPNIDFLSSIVSFLHEFTHYLCQKYGVNLNGKLYYEEILSLYVEKYAVYSLSKNSKDSSFINKLESTRLEALVWHYKQKLYELEKIFEKYQNLKRNNPSEAKMFEKSISSLIATSEGRNIIYGYEKCLADSYGIGYLFGDALYRKGLEDEKILRDKILHLIFEDKSLDNLLKYYGISTNNFSLYDQSYANAKKVLNK